MRPVQVMRAHSLAHMELTPNDKASLAGSWLSKRLILQMSVEVAALVMGCCTENVCFLPKADISSDHI